MIDVLKMIRSAEQRLQPAFARLEDMALANEKRVLDAFREEAVSPRHFAPTEGYGYDDLGRDALDRVFARALQTQDALVRPQIANGTHAIFLALSGLLEPGDVVFSATGRPYDTLETAVGLSGSEPNALSRSGIGFRMAALKETGEEPFDQDAILRGITDHPEVKMLYVQRSRGYAWREAVSVEKMGPLFQRVKAVRPDIIIAVDNCYGEFTEDWEPSAAGADVMMGSLIKNCGGGIAPTGGYIAGRKDLIERVSYRLTVPGSGREVGSYAASYRPYFQGLFLAPHTVLQCLKTAMLFGEVFGKLGYEVMPAGNKLRADIVQSIRFREPGELIAFCKAVQHASPVDSDVTPEPWDMPGYTDPVIMAAGTFVQGATTELSADGPIRPPFAVYMQGSLTYEHGKLALMEVAQAVMEQREAGER
jgi:cystathionine beta-lyase family protein involved in aluminum resistance